MIKYFYTLVAILGFSITVQAQSGEIQGKVVNEAGEAMPFAQLIIVTDAFGKNPTSKGTKANMNGLYTLKGLSAGKVNLMCKALGYTPNVETDIMVYTGQPVIVNFIMVKTGTLGVVKVKAKSITKTPPVINVFKPKETVIGAVEIKESAVRGVGDIAASTSGVVQEDIGGGLNMGGSSRGDGVVYFIDGVKVTGTPNVSATSIQQLEVAVSGVPAKYGDANAGVVSITTKGPSSKFAGSVEGLTSQFLDPYGYNLLGTNLSGPLIRKKATYDTLDPLEKNKKIKGETILGYALNVEYQSEADYVPTINGNWKVKDDVYSKILNDPYRLSSDGSRLLLNQSFLTANDLEKTSSHQNTGRRSIRLNGKLDWKVVPNSTNITIGGRVENTKFNNFVQRYSLLNYQNNPEYIDKSYNGYIRLYQPLFNPDKQANKLFQNTALTIQADYTKNGRDYVSPVGGDNPWNYGYIGKFEELSTPNYTRVTGGDGGKVYYAPGEYLSFGDYMTGNALNSNGVKYTPGTINPLAARQTEQFIDLFQKSIRPLTSINAIDNAGGIINGKRSAETVHDLFYPAARIFNGIQKEENDQYRLTGSINFDIINNKSATRKQHTIEAGFEIEQRINRQYNISPNSFWTTAQSQLLNSHLSPDNTRNYNPLLIMRNGTVKMRLQDYMIQLKDSTNPIHFAAFDSVYYDKEVSNGDQSEFSKNLRQALGYDSLTRLNIHELDPSKMSVNWFSADELINNGFVSANGYDVYGNKISNSTTFQEFFKDKDNRGNYTRHVAPFMPRYAAGYIQDRFQLKDMAFNLGFRVDYFDANSYQLIDPYVPQGARDISDPEVKNKGWVIPSNLPSDAVVYVDNPTNPTRVTGFRAGSKWYDKKGLELLSPKSIELETGSNVTPYLKGNTAEERAKRDMTSSTFDPDLIFKKTTGKFAFAPRLNFTFQIDSFALLFAHYDVLNQRPEQDATSVDASNYYNLLSRKSTTFINNPGLDFSSSTDLELGFKQRLSPKSSLTINFNYREYANQVNYIRIDGGFPNGYNTWGNADFQTVKSFGLSYELRRVRSSILRMKFNYTMQFAEGTGSSRTAQQNLVNAGLGNIKVIFPLDNETRHQINGNFNVRFADGENYYGPAKLRKIFENFGVNLDVNLRSGTPYTLQSNPTPTAFMNSTARAVNLGDVNSASQPYRFNANLKIDKDFQFKFGKSTKDEKGLTVNNKIYSINVYLQIQNLLNLYNTIKVYRFTGNAETDGYLASSDGILQYNQNEAIAKGYGQGFRDLYNLSLEIPQDRNSMYARPRIIQLGAVMSF